MQCVRRPAAGLAVLLALGLAHAGAQAPPSADGLYMAYAGGDYDVVSRTLRNRDIFGGLRGDLLRLAGDWVARSDPKWWVADARQKGLAADAADETAARAWRAFWAPAHATFLLEVGAVALELKFPLPGQFISAAGSIVMNRPSPPGTRAVEDTFEILFHRTALAVLVGARSYEDAYAYLDAIDRRVFPARAADGKPRLVDLRPALVRGVLADLQTKDAQLVPGRAGGPATIRETPAAKKSTAVALAAYKLAAQAPELAAETSVRRAFLLFRVGQPRPALDALAATSTPTDPVVGYWGGLIQGRILDALGQPEDAIAAYRRAAALFPGAQTAKLALATAQLGLGHRDDAWRLAAEARSTPDRPIDPWWQYWSGDLRFVPQWLPALRRGAS
jgi:tetratricopeptide (TPR) repeat protein